MLHRDVPTAMVSLGLSPRDHACRLQYVEVVREQISRHTQIGPQLLHTEVADEEQFDNS